MAARTIVEQMCSSGCSGGSIIYFFDSEKMTHLCPWQTSLIDPQAGLGHAANQYPASMRLERILWKLPGLQEWSGGICHFCFTGESWLTRLQMWTSRGADLSAVIHAKPWQNKPGIGVTRSPAGADVFTVTLHTMTGSHFHTDCENLWKWKPGVETNGRRSLSVSCSNQVNPPPPRPPQVWIWTSALYKSPSLKRPPNENQLWRELDR